MRIATLLIAIRKGFLEFIAREVGYKQFKRWNKKTQRSLIQKTVDPYLMASEKGEAGTQI